MLALRALKLEAERLLEAGPHGLQRRQVDGLDPGERVTGVGSEQPRKIGRAGERCEVGEGPAKVLDEAGTLGACGAPRVGAGIPERSVVLGQGEAFQPHRLAARVHADEQKVTVVGDQDEAVALPVARDLAGVGGRGHRLGEALDLNHAALRDLALAFPRRAAPALGLRVEPEVGMPRALAAELAVADDPWLERLPDRVEQGFEGAVVGGLARGATRGADLGHASKVVLDQAFRLCGHDPLPSKSHRATSLRGSTARPVLSPDAQLRPD
jgi:hypothetical protein